MAEAMLARFLVRQPWSSSRDEREDLRLVAPPYQSFRRRELFFCCAWPQQGLARTASWIAVPTISLDWKQMRGQLNVVGQRVVAFCRRCRWLARLLVHAGATRPTSRSWRACAPSECSPRRARGSGVRRTCPPRIRVPWSRGARAPPEHLSGSATPSTCPLRGALQRNTALRGHHG